MIGSELNVILLIISFVLLLVGSWQDIRTREVQDWIWLTMIGGGIIVHSLQLILRFLANEAPVNYFTKWIFNVIISILLALFLTFSGLGGEADRIAYVAIGVISPISLPLFVFQDLIYKTLIDITPRILGIFFNAYLFTLPVPVLISCYNIANQRLHPELYNISNESKLTRIFIRFIGYPRQTLHLSKDLKEKPWHFDFLEEFKQEAGWRVIFRVRLDTPENDFSRKQDTIKLLEAQDKHFIWVQPSLPFIFILMLGFIAEILFGNLIFLSMVILS